MDYKYDRREVVACLKKANQVGQTILEQMGGIRRLSAMLGVQQYGWLPKGVYFKWAAKQRSKGNYVEITLRPDDTYHMEFFSVTTKGKKLIKKYSEVHADQLAPLFEKQTGLYLRFAKTITASSMKRITGGARSTYVEEVWSMYKNSYMKIGLSVSSLSGLLKYDVWDLFFDKEGNPIAFNLYKKTPMGLKTGLLGSDGSSEGKSLIKQHIKSKYKQPGVYGEVSHAVEKLSQGAPIVCAIYVPQVLGKSVVPERDGVHYRRSLEGVGMVTKKLVGRPKGVPISTENACPAPDADLIPSARLAEEEDHEVRLGEHFSCLLDLD